MKKFSNKKITITSKKRFIFTIFLVISVCFIISSKCFGKKEIQTYNYTVQNSDTLWNISKSICNKSDENIDIQNVVRDIKIRNNLYDSNIFVGQVLNLPIY